MSKSHEFAWAAGFFDGEGWVKIQKRTGKYLGYYLRVGINHVRPEPLEKIQRIFGGKIRWDDRQQGNRKGRHVWTLSTAQAAEFLRCILPYLANKDREAELGLEYYSTVGKRGQSTSDETKIYRVLLAEEIKRINAEG